MKIKYIKKLAWMLGLGLCTTGTTYAIQLTQQEVDQLPIHQIAVITNETGYPITVSNYEYGNTYMTNVGFPIYSDSSPLQNGQSENVYYVGNYTYLGKYQVNATINGQNINCVNINDPQLQYEPGFISNHYYNGQLPNANSGPDYPEILYCNNQNYPMYDMYTILYQNNIPISVVTIHSGVYPSPNSSS